jgi:hypothetical protein
MHDSVWAALASLTDKLKTDQAFQDLIMKRLDGVTHVQMKLDEMVHVAHEELAELQLFQEQTSEWVQATDNTMRIFR